MILAYKPGRVWPLLQVRMVRVKDFAGVKYYPTVKLKFLTGRKGKMGVIQEIDRHLEKMVIDIGPRPTGSKNNRKAYNYIGREMAGYGFAVEKQEFDCIDWFPGGASFLMEGREIRLKEADYTLPCNLGGKLHCIENIEQLRKSDIQGELVFLFGELTREPLMPKKFPFYNPPEHKRIIALLEEKNPGAILFASCSKESLVPLIEDGDFNIPCAVVPVKEQEYLLGNKNSPVRLVIKSSRKPARAANIISRGWGEKPRIAVSAHLDTKPFTPGALDNAVGVAAILVLGKVLGPGRLKNQLELIAFNGEDYFSNAGEVVFSEKSLSEPGDYLLGVNIDGIGYLEGQTGFSFFELCEEKRSRIRKITKKIPGICEIAPWPQGDHMVFVGCGIPAVAITSTQVFGILESVIHTPEDRLEIVDRKKIAECVAFLVEWLTDL